MPSTKQKQFADLYTEAQACRICPNLADKTAVLSELIAVGKVDKRAEFLRRVDQFHFPLPEGYRFDRDEANER